MFLHKNGLQYNSIRKWKIINPTGNLTEAKHQVMSLNVKDTLCPLYGLNIALCCVKYTENVWPEYKTEWTDERNEVGLEEAQHTKHIFPVCHPTPTNKKKKKSHL